MKKRPRRSKIDLGGQDMASQVTPLSESKDKPKLQKEETLDQPVTKFEDLEGKFLLVRVKTDDLPIDVADQEINKIANQLNELLEIHNVQCMALVTHSRVDVQIIEKGMS